MTDVRLTALNPVDSQVYPVACNTSGELIVEQVDPGPDLTVTGDLTVEGSSVCEGTLTVNENINGLKVVSGSGATSQPVLRVYSDTLSAYTTNLNADGSATFVGDITCSNNTKGLILKSPNGTLYRLSVANDGTLSTSGV